MTFRFRRETNFVRTKVGEVPQEWKLAKIKDIGTVVTGKTPPTKERSYWGGAYPFVTPSDIKDFRTRSVPDVERYVSVRWLSKSESLLLPKGTVCFVCIGGSIGKTCLLQRPSFTNQQINSVVVSQSADPKFVYYLLRCNRERITDEYGGGGAAKEIINKSTFEDIEIGLPVSREEQSHIANTLSCFDDQIENDERQNQILKQMAISLFRNWFINFEPFKDGGLVDSPFGRIPKDWQVVSIDHLADLRNGFPYTGNEKHQEPVKDGYLFVTLNNIHEGGGFKPEYSWIQSDRLTDNHFLEEGDLIMTNIHFGVGGSDTGRLFATPALVVFPSDYRKNAVYSMDLTKILPFDKEYRLYLYLYLMLTREDSLSFSTGTSVLHLDMENFKRNKLVLVPTRLVLEKFNTIVEPLLRKTSVNQKQMMLLMGARDSLLPLLVFGRLRVEET